MAFVSESTQYEISNHTAVYHEGDDIHEFIGKTIDRIVNEFGEETAYRIVNIKHRRNNAQRIMVQKAGIEPLAESALVENLQKHLYDVVKKNFTPIVLEVRLFVSTNEPKL